MSELLRECPFHEPASKHGVFVTGTSHGARVDCAECGALGPLCRTKTEAIAAWNRRAHPAPAPLSGEQERAEFEKWAKNEGHAIDREYVNELPTGYADDYTQWCWQAWQAARAQQHGEPVARKLVTPAPPRYDEVYHEGVKRLNEGDDDHFGQPNYGHQTEYDPPATPPARRYSDQLKAAELRAILDALRGLKGQEFWDGVLAKLRAALDEVEKPS